MKKTLVSLVILAAVVFGGLKFNSSKVEQKYNETLAAMKESGLNVQNSVFNGGLLDSNASYEIVISKDELSDAFSLVDEDRLKEDLRLKFDIFIAHGFESFLGKFSVKGETEILDEPYKNIAREVFGTTKPLEFYTSEDFARDKSVTFELANLQKQHEEGRIGLGKTTLNLILDEKKIGQISTKNDFVEIAIKENVKIKINDIDYNVKYEKPIELKEVFKALADTTAKMQIGSINASFDGKMLEIGKITSGSKVLIANDALSQDDMTTIEKVKFEGFEFNEIVLKSRIENIDKGALEDIINLDNKKPEDEIMGVLMGAFEKFIKRGPRVTFENLNFKNRDGKKFASNFDLYIDSKDNDGQDLMTAIVNFINFGGKIELDTTPGDFIFDKSQEKVNLDVLLLESGIFIENSGKYVSNFKYNQRIQDVIFNDNVSIKSLME